MNLLKKYKNGFINNISIVEIKEYFEYGNYTNKNGIISIKNNTEYLLCASKHIIPINSKKCNYKDCYSYFKAIDINNLRPFDCKNCYISAINKILNGEAMIR